MKATRKVWLYVGLSAVGAVLLTAVGLYVWVSWEQHLPSEQTARQHFDSHRTDFVRFVSLVRLNPGARFIGSDGSTSNDAGDARVVPEYRDLMRRIGVQFVDVREDGSIEFALWGFGCAICSDSYIGVRYFRADYNAQAHPGWAPKLVTSLDSESLPREKGSVADGLYVVQLEHEWFLYRLEIH